MTAPDSQTLRRSLGGCCAGASADVIGTDYAETLAMAFKALGDPTRVRLLSLIAASDGGEACICNLTEPVNLTQPTVSHHMKRLADAGFVTREQRGKWAFYRAVPERVRALGDAIVTLGRATPQVEEPALGGPE